MVHLPIDIPLSKGSQPGSILPEISSASNVREMETYNRPLSSTAHRFAFIAYGLSRKGCNTGCTTVMCVRCLNIDETGYTWRSCFFFSFFSFEEKRKKDSFLKINYPSLTNLLF